MNRTYKRMLSKMQPGLPGEPWILYILKCRDGSFYTGIAKNLQKRLQAHNTGKGAKYTRTRLPVTLLYQESCESRTHALVRECAVKALPRNKKEALVGKISAA